MNVVCALRSDYSNDNIIQALEESHNIVSVYQFQGKDIQSSFDCAGELLKSRYREWYLTLTELPTWGEKIDSEVQMYINSVQNVALANLNWRLVHFGILYFIHSILSIIEANQFFVHIAIEQKDIGTDTIMKFESLVSLHFQFTKEYH